MSEEPNSGSEASHENMHSLIEICYSESDLYLDEVVNGNAPPPASPPPLAHPSMWNPKTHTVQEQLALQANTAAPMHVAEPALGAEATGQDEVATEAGAEEVKKAKRIYHRWGDNVVDFFFDFEGLHALPRNTCVKLVKDNYPAIFPPHFNESVVRKWENNGKQNKKSNGPGKDWRKSHTILPMELLVFLGTLVTRQYLAGVPMTARLLVPLLAGAAVAKGYGECITLDSRPLAQGSANDKKLRISERWVRNFCREFLNMSFRRPTRSQSHAHTEGKLESVSRIFLLRLAFLVHQFSIPKALVINMDETGVHLLPLRTRGWAPQGRKQQVVAPASYLRLCAVIHKCYFCFVGIDNHSI